jgi:hypothetical protein
VVLIGIGSADPPYTPLTETSAGLLPDAVWASLATTAPPDPCRRCPTRSTTEHSQ